MSAATCKRLFECERSTSEQRYGTEGTCVARSNTFCELFKNYECEDLSAFERCVNDIETVLVRLAPGVDPVRVKQQHYDLPGGRRLRWLRWVRR